MFKLTKTNAIGTIWRFRGNIFMITGPIVNNNYHIMNMKSGMLHYTQDYWSLADVIKVFGYENAEYIGHLSELDIASFVE